MIGRAQEGSKGGDKHGGGGDSSLLSKVTQGGDNLSNSVTGAASEVSLKKT